MLAFGILLFIQTAGEATSACADEKSRLSSYYHAPHACEYLNYSSIAYTATYRASLIPRPGRQQIVVYQHNDGWRMRLAGYSWEIDTNTVITRRRELDLSEEDVKKIPLHINYQKLDDLAEEPYYGSGDLICLDGAELEIAIAEDGRFASAARHTCSNFRSVDQLTNILWELAIQKDPSFEGLLYALKLED